MAEKHYVVEVTVKEVIPETTSVNIGNGYNSQDRGKTVKVDRQVNEKLKIIATTGSLGEAIDRIADWAANEKKYLPGGAKSPIEITERPR